MSIDGTQDILRKIKAEHPEWKYYFHDVNIGRGGTVTEGFMKSEGAVVGFIDIDLEMELYDRYNIQLCRLLVRLNLKLSSL